MATLLRWMLRLSVLAYVAMLVAVPVIWIVWKAVGAGIASTLQAAATPDALRALALTLAVAGAAVAVNTIFGIAVALSVVRHPFRGSGLLTVLSDLPLALSPVVVGLGILLVYGDQGWLGPWVRAFGVQVVFSPPGMILATTFVTMPFVLREVIPVAREVGTQQEEAARTLGASPWQVFWRITLPAISSGVLYGAVLTTARAIGEFGAVSVVAGNLSGAASTQTVTMYVDTQFQNFNMTGAYVSSVELAIIAVATLMGMSLLRRRATISTRKSSSGT